MGFKIELGSFVRSRISGFEGVVTSRSEHINGCARYWVAPKVDKDGKLPDGYWIDEVELEVIHKPFIESSNRDRGGFPSQVK